MLPRNQVTERCYVLNCVPSSAFCRGGKHTRLRFSLAVLKKGTAARKSSPEEFFGSCLGCAVTQSQQT
eukprot:2184024-Amphidinium_carterae.1